MATSFSVEQKVYGLSHYHGVPESLSEKFQSEPFLPGFFARAVRIPARTDFDFCWALPFCWVSAPALVLFVMGLVYVSLTFWACLDRSRWRYRMACSPCDHDRNTH